MIKFPLGDADSKEKFFLSNSFGAVDGAELIPIHCGGRLITPTVSVNELGKQLLKAAAEGNVEETRTLLNKGALFTADWLGTSPLHLAARNNHLEVVEILLKAGISRDARTKVDKTSLHMAAAEGHVSIVETLLEYGSDPDCRDLLGMTPLHWAAQNGHLDVVKALLQHYAQTNVVNKFDLTPAGVAAQIDRHDIVALINRQSEEVEEPTNAAQHLTLELVENDEGALDGAHSPIPLETILMEDNESSIDPEKLHLNKNPDEQNHDFSESIKLLQEHGITMLPNDDSNILTTVMETGHSVVLTDAGKQVLNAIKESEQKANAINKKIITVTPQEFLSMASNCKNKSKNIIKQINGRLVPKNVKRIVMKKNKLIPVSTVNNMYKISGPNGVTDMETVMTQLIEARKTIEEYKIKLLKKEQEAERYKQQLKLLMDDS
ncbi:GA-binding protein subunit beta-1 isoform X2 [Tribolium castaneum]|uniref:Spatzle 5 n=2 Tax=Tribolium castaneum TaxID=7070 RepID=D6X3V1_TRICA|nr:PREDICTED: GA-binding protein subunit beta-1 isoform X2 [Tribolium castaneum]XP_971070.2 PREDICTED: GA-binding protein subunit beta-1 isoform X2 [Tribolium castaneum]EEZ97725.1 spatzle 5 [Tribolium castaneum]|eukprot:XP_008194513.1 PREDICTED: GA-binding protein subunit beta-1 isoform X2 [Tribolium castaneum]